MFVRSAMKSIHQCFTVSPNESVKTALNLMNNNSIQAMPVVDEDKIFKGMISKQDIYQAFFQEDLERTEFLESKIVADILTQHDLYISEDEVFENTLTTFKGFPILAVVNEQKKFLGIISRFDVIEQFESVFGMKKPGVRIAFTSEESSGRFARLADILKQLHANIISITTFDETDKLARRIVLKVNEDVDANKLKSKLERAGFRVLDIKNM
ncbi:CBS domain-containing protein [Paraliobacillus sediminis]|uniref:CBS domain-containing protein n=1 Tax=Paraliobacillus sediminis TaxID=1885916 RepID=UPI000E3E5EB3|nr:CBS domain-containing protein [Paraliobacillus sediminis]